MKKRMLMLLISLLVVCSCFIPAQAAEVIDPAREGTLDVYFSLGDGTDLTGMQFDLYRVADVLNNGKTQLCNDFASLDADISLTPTDAWAVVTTEAANLVRRNGLTPEQSAYLNEDGVAHFPEAGKKIIAGIYLVFPRTLEIGGRKIVCSPTLAALPLEDGGWNYNVRVTPKGGPSTSEDYLEVVKIWNDKGSEKKRPESVLVDLYCDGVLVDTQEISADMQWKYRWEPAPVWKTLGQAGNGPGSDVTIEGEHSWYVIERNVDGYKTTYALSGDHRFVITNTIQDDTPSTPENKLPQTGTLWWPVPILVLAGLSLMYLGRTMAKREREHE